MKNRMFSKVGILLAAMVLINTALQAQSWLDPTKSIRISTSLITEAYAQKVRPFKNDYLISISNKANPNYCFTVWTNGNIILRKSMLDSADVVVNDFTLLNNVVYFCGKHLNNQGNPIGCIGKLTVNQLLGAQNFTYQLQDIALTEELTNIVAYQDASNATHVVAIGHGAATANPYGRFVCMDGTGNYYVLNSNTPSQYQKEIFEDIAVGDVYVATVGRVYPSDSVIVRYYDKTNPHMQALQHTYTYYSPNVALNSSFNPYEFTSHITKLPNAFMAIATSAQDNNHKDYTMINVLQEGQQPIVASRVCYHQDKNNKIFEMDYSFEMDSLLILHGEQISNNYVYSTLSLHLQTQPTYNSFAREIPGVINHLSVIPNKRYALAGIAPSLNNRQLLYVRQIPAFLTSCGKNIQFKIGNGPTLGAYQYMGIFINSSYTNNWLNYTATMTTDKLNVECKD